MKLGHALALLGLVTNVTPAAAGSRGPATSCEARVDVELPARPGARELAAAARKVADASRKLRFTPAVQLLGPGVAAASLAALGRDPAFASVPALRVPCLGAEAWSALQADVFPGLTTLDPGLGCPRDVAAMKALLALPRRTPLTIVVSRTAWLSKTAALEELARLAPDSPVTFSVAARCADVARLDRTGFLRHVSRVATFCGDGGAKALARATNTGALRGVTINACIGENNEPEHPMTHASARALAGAPGLAGVVDLAFNNDFEFCQERGIGRAGLEDLLSSPLAARLQSLTLTQQSLGPKGVAALVTSARLPVLRQLAVQGERFSASNLRRLVQTGPLVATLEDLALPGAELDEGQDLDDTTGRALAAALKMPKLRRLDVTMNRFDEGEMMERIRRAPWARALEILDVGSSGQGQACLPSWHEPAPRIDMRE